MADFRSCREREASAAVLIPRPPVSASSYLLCPPAVVGCPQPPKHPDHPPPTPHRIHADTNKVRITFPEASLIAEELLKTEFDSARIVYNRFVTAIAQKPTIATVLSPDVSWFEGPELWRPGGLQEGEPLLLGTLGGSVSAGVPAATSAVWFETGADRAGNPPGWRRKPNPMLACLRTLPSAHPPALPPTNLLCSRWSAPLRGAPPLRRTSWRGRTALRC